MSIVYRRGRLSTYVYDPVTDTFSHKTDPSRPVSPIYEKPKVLKEHKRERRKNQRYLFMNIFKGRKGWVFEVNEVFVDSTTTVKSVCGADIAIVLNYEIGYADRGSDLCRRSHRQNGLPRQGF